jgi:hypothetical protein
MYFSSVMMAGPKRIEIVKKFATFVGVQALQLLARSEVLQGSRGGYWLFNYAINI